MVAKSTFGGGAGRREVPWRLPASRKGSSAGSGVRDYGSAFDRAASRVAIRSSEYADEQADVPTLRAELALHSVDQQLLLVANRRRFQTWALAHALIEDCEDLRPKNPAAAVARGQVAVALSETLDQTYYGAERVYDLCARALSNLATALRSQDQFREAEEAFERAYRFLDLGTGDPVERAHVMTHEAAFRTARSQFERSHQLLEGVITIARRQKETHLLGRALINKSFAFSCAGEPEAAIRYLEEGSRLIDPAIGPRLLLVANHNLIDALIDTSRFEEACERLDRVRELHNQFGNRIDQIRFRWVEAKIAAGLNRFGVAERLLLRVRSEFAEAELGFDTALVSLDLAAIYSRQGRAAELKRLATEILPILCARDIHREALAALRFFYEAVEMEQVSLALVEELSTFLQRARHCPYLRFHPGAGETPSA